MTKGTYVTQKSIYVCTGYLLEVHKNALQHTFDKGTNLERKMKVVSIRCSYLNTTNPPIPNNLEVLIEIEKKAELPTTVVLSKNSETTKAFYEILHTTLCEIGLKMWEDSQTPEKV